MKPKSTVWFVVLAILVVLGITSLAVQAGDQDWTTHSLQGLDVRSFAINPSAPTHLYAIAPNAIFHSIDGGSEWSLLQRHDLGQLGPGQFAIDPLSPSIFYAASQGRLQRSVDGGQTWEQMAPGLLIDVRWFVVDPEDPNTIWAMTGADTLRTRDGGQNWASAGLPVKGPATGFVQSGDTIYLAVERQGIFRSDDAGKTWLAIGSGLPAGAYMWDLSRDLQTGEVYTNSDYGPFRSQDQGNTWEPIIPEGSWYSSGLENLGGRLLLISGNLQATSDNGGSTWQVREQPGFGQLWQIEGDPGTAGVVYALTDAGLWKSFDYGANWRAPQSAPTSIQLLASHPGRPDRVYGAYGSVWRSEDGGANWQPDATFAENQPLAAIAWAPSNANIAYASSGQGLLRSEDGGDAVWDATLLPATTRVTAIYVSPHDPNTVYLLSDGRVLVSTSAGEAWGELGLPIDQRFNDLAMSFQNPNIIYAVSEDAVLRSVDGGGSWAVRFEGWSRLAQMKVDPVDDQHLAALGNGQVFVSRDGGSSWREAGGVLNQGNIQQLFVHPSEPTLLYAHDAQQISISPNGGETWLPLGQPIVDGIASVVAGGTNSRYVLVRTNRGALWRYDFTDLPPTPTPTPTLTPTITPTPTLTSTPMPPTATPRPRLTVAPAATAVDLEPPQRPRSGRGGQSDFPVGLVAALVLLGLAAAGGFLYYRRRGASAKPSTLVHDPPATSTSSLPQSVTCSKGHTSPPGSRFCMACGEQLNP